MIVEGSNFPPPPDAKALDSLRDALPAEMPRDYFEFLTRADGAQVWFNKDGPAGFDCIRIYSVARMLQLRPSLIDLFPSLVVIGGDQGSQYVGYDNSVPPPWPIVMLLPGYGATKIADSFTDLARRYFRNIGETVDSLPTVADA